MLASNNMLMTSDLRDCGLRYFASNRRYFLSGISMYGSFRFLYDFYSQSRAHLRHFRQKTGHEANCTWLVNVMLCVLRKEKATSVSVARGFHLLRREITGSHGAHSYIVWQNWELF